MLCCAVLSQASFPEVQEELYQELVAAGIAPAGEDNTHLGRGCSKRCYAKRLDSSVWL